MDKGVYFERLFLLEMWCYNCMSVGEHNIKMFGAINLV